MLPLVGDATPVCAARLRAHLLMQADIQLHLSCPIISWSCASPFRFVKTL